MSDIYGDVVFSWPEDNRRGNELASALYSEPSVSFIQPTYDTTNLFPTQATSEVDSKLDPYSLSAEIKAKLDTTNDMINGITAQRSEHYKQLDDLTNFAENSPVPTSVMLAAMLGGAKFPLG